MKRVGTVSAMLLLGFFSETVWCNYSYRALPSKFFVAALSIFHSFCRKINRDSYHKNEISGP